MNIFNILQAAYQRIASVFGSKDTRVTGSNMLRDARDVYGQAIKQQIVIQQTQLDAIEQRYYKLRAEVVEARDRLDTLQATYKQLVKERQMDN